MGNGRTTEGTGVGVGKKSGSSRLFYAIGGIIILALIFATATQLGGNSAPIAETPKTGTDQSGTGGGSGSGSSGNSGIVSGETKISDNVSVSGMIAENFYEVAKKSDLSQGEYAFIQPEIVYVSSNDNAAKTASNGQFYVAFEAGKKNTLDNLVIKYKGITLEGFSITESSGWVTIKTKITPNRYPSKIIASFTAAKDAPFKLENFIRVSREESQPISISSIKEIAVIKVESKKWNMGKFSLLQLYINTGT